jgi:serine kinase of HPr protein (carbohydrate metabolism regulator)
MTKAAISSETLHASCVAIGGHAVLLHGRSGCGKSDLALRLVDRGATLVSDDYTLLRRVDDRLVASPPPTIAGRIEVRGIGIVDLPHVTDAEVRMLVMLDEPTPRMPAEIPARRSIAGIEVPVVALPPFDASAPIKVELALRHFGLGEIWS